MVKSLFHAYAIPYIIRICTELLRLYVSNYVLTFDGSTCFNVHVRIKFSIIIINGNKISLYHSWFIVYINIKVSYANRVHLHIETPLAEAVSHAAISNGNSLRSDVHTSVTEVISNATLTDPNWSCFDKFTHCSHWLGFLIGTLITNQVNRNITITNSHGPCSQTITLVTKWIHNTTVTYTNCPCTLLNRAFPSQRHALFIFCDKAVWVYRF